MADIQWIKLYLDIFDTNPKISKIRRLPSGNDIALIWIMLLVKAGRCNAGGHIFITENVPCAVEDLADDFKFKANTIKRALEIFVELDMITVDNEGFIFINGWEKHQNMDRLAEVREQTRKRVAKHRNKKLVTECNAASNVTGNVTVTECNAIEEERRKKIEDKEKDSFFTEREESGSHSSFFPLFQKSDSVDIRRDRLASVGEGLVVIDDEQLKELYEKISLKDFEHYVEVIRSCLKRGRKYSRQTHAQAILNMAKADGKLITRPQNSSFDTDEFFEAALRKSYEKI